MMLLLYLRVYDEQLHALQQELADLEGGRHEEMETFKRSNEQEYHERLDYNQLVYDVEVGGFTNIIYHKTKYYYEMNSLSS